MEQKTIVKAEEGKQEIFITREFELPVELLFRAYVEPEIIEQWMGTKVLMLDNKKYGGYQFQTSDDKGNVLFQANGTIHEIIENQLITRTFEMENANFGVQLEFLEFERLTDDTSKLTMQMIYRSAALRDANLKLPFKYGINMAHDQLEKVLSQLL